MSKTAKELGLILGGLALAAASGPLGIIALQGSIAAFHAMLGLGITTALSGIGMALRPTPGTPVGTPNSIGFAEGVSPRRVIYGQFQTAGVLTYASFPPSQNLATTSQFLHLVYTLAGHEISSFDAVVVNGYVYNFGSDLLKDSSLPSTPWQVHPAAAITPVDFYWEHMMFEFDFGDPLNTSAPFPNLSNADSSWTAACQQIGCAKVHVILRADSGWPGLYPSGQIPNIQFLVTGKKLIDPRVVTAWAANTNYTGTQYTIDQDPRGAKIWLQMNAGPVTSGGMRPNFEAAFVGATLIDSSCTWHCTATLAAAFSGLQGTPQLVNSAGTFQGGFLQNDGWQPSAGATRGQVIESPPGYFQRCTVPGTTGSTRPGFFTVAGGTVGDGGATWQSMGRSPHALNTSNSALVVYDYLMDSDAGLATPAASIDTASVIAAANICEEQALIIWNPDGTKVFENIYSCSGMFDHGSTRGDVLSSICASMAGWVVPPGDLWHVFAGAYITPTIALGDGDLRGGIKGDFRLSRRDVANSIKGTFSPAYLPSSPAAAISLTSVPGTWQSQSFPPYQANGLAHKPDYITEDGGQVIWQDAHYEFTTSIWAAQRLAKIALMRLRFQQTLTLPFKMTAFALEAGDTFKFTHLRWGINAGVFEATQVAITIDTGSNAPTVGIDVVARQTDPSVYSFTAPSSPSDYGEYSPYGVTGVMSGVE